MDDFLIHVQAYFILDIDTWFTRVKSLSDYSSKLTNSLGWTGRYVCLLSGSNESLWTIILCDAVVDPLFELPASFLVVLFDIFSCNWFQTCCRRRAIAYFTRVVLLSLSHFFISSEARESASEKLAIRPWPWSVVGSRPAVQMWNAMYRRSKIWQAMRTLCFFNFEMKNKWNDNSLAFS